MMRNGTLLASAVLTAQLALSAEVGMVRLAGTPEQIGETFETMNREIIAGDMDATELGKRTASDGALWDAQKARWEALERAMHDEKGALKQAVKENLAAGKPVEAEVQRLEDWSANKAAMIMEAQQLTESAIGRR